MLLQDVLIGAGAGSIAGRMLIHRSERRRGREWPAMRVRQVEANWIAAGIAVGLASRVLFN